MEHAEVVNAILLNKDVNAADLMTVEKSLIVKRLSSGFDTSFDWSDGADIGPFCKVFFTPLQLALLYGHECVVELEKRLEYDTGVTALQIAKKMRRDEILKILTDIPEVKRLEKERQTHVNAANTILVVAALIGSVTFAGGLQPPLGYSPFFGSANPPVGAPSPVGMYPSFASVEFHPTMPVFCLFNSLSFVCAIAALVLGAAAARPPRTQVYTQLVLPRSRRLLRFAYSALYFSVTFALVTFVTVGLMVFPPIAVYSTIFYIIDVIAVVLILMTCFFFGPGFVSDIYPG
jgi:hypothetical protein